MAVIPFLRQASTASVSPDLTKIAYLDQGGYPRLHILDSNTGEEILTSRDCDSTTWAPDSRSILCGGSPISLLPLDGTEPVELTACGEPPEDNYWCSPLYWSPDASYIAAPRMAAPIGGPQEMRYDIFLVQLSCGPDSTGCIVQSSASISSRSVTCDWLYNGRQLLCRDNDEMLRILEPPSPHWRALPDNPCIDWTSIAASPSQPLFACNLKSDDGYDSIGIGVIPVDASDARVVLPDPKAIVDFWLHIP